MRNKERGARGPQVNQEEQVSSGDRRTLRTQHSALSTQHLERLAEAGLDPARLPRHVAIIMDGNGRWARQRDLPRIEGHRRGVQSVRATVEESCRLGLQQLTLYCLSIENWKRPRHELEV